MRTRFPRKELRRVSASVDFPAPGSPRINKDRGGSRRVNSSSSGGSLRIALTVAPLRDSMRGQAPSYFRHCLSVQESNERGGGEVRGAGNPRVRSKIRGGGPP